MYVMSSIRYVLSMQILFITFSLSSCRSDYSLIYEHTKKNINFVKDHLGLGLAQHFLEIHSRNIPVKYCFTFHKGPSWSWSYGGWIYNYLCNQCLSPITIKVVSSNPIHCEVYSKASSTHLRTVLMDCCKFNLSHKALYIYWCTHWILF